MSCRMLLYSNSFKKSASVSSRPDVFRFIVKSIALVIFSSVIGGAATHSPMDLSILLSITRLCNYCLHISIGLSLTQFLFPTTVMNGARCLYIPAASNFFVEAETAIFNFQLPRYFTFIIQPYFLVIFYFPIIVYCGLYHLFFPFLFCPRFFSIISFFKVVVFYMLTWLLWIYLVLV